MAKKPLEHVGKLLAMVLNSENSPASAMNGYQPTSIWGIMDLMEANDSSIIPRLLNGETIENESPITENQQELVDDLMYTSKIYSGKGGLERTFSQFGNEGRTLPLLESQRRFIDNLIDPVGHLCSLSPEMQANVHFHVYKIAEENGVHIQAWDHEYGKHHAEEDLDRLIVALQRHEETRLVAI